MQSQMLKLLMFSRLFFTGEYAYHEDSDYETVKKTVNVVKQLCQPH